MPAETAGGVITTFITSSYFLSIIKAGILLILIFYAIFAVIIIRQVDLMGKTFVTDISPVLKAFSIIHAGFAIGLIFLAWGIL